MIFKSPLSCNSRDGVDVVSVLAMARRSESGKGEKTACFQLPPLEEVATSSYLSTHRISPETSGLHLLKLLTSWWSKNTHQWFGEFISPGCQYTEQLQALAGWHAARPLEISAAILFKKIFLSCIFFLLFYNNFPMSAFNTNKMITVLFAFLTIWIKLFILFIHSFIHLRDNHPGPPNDTMYWQI